METPGQRDDGFFFLAAEVCGLSPSRPPSPPGLMQPRAEWIYFTDCCRQGTSRARWPRERGIQATALVMEMEEARQDLPRKRRRNAKSRGWLPILLTFQVRHIRGETFEAENL